MNQWPSSLPQYLLTAGDKESPPNLVIRTAMDAGPAKMRQRFTATVRPLQGELMLSQDQVETLDEFYLANCAIAWSWTRQRTTEDTESPTDTESPMDTENFAEMYDAAIYRFVKPPEYADAGDGRHYKVTLYLEIMP